jgi:hypothetical protein
MNARLIAEKLASTSTRWIGSRWGDSFPFYYVSEYPKSGGTWLARMISDYLQIPFPRFSLLPPTFASVVHNHWAYQPGLRRVFYIYRDGRDVMTSLYFHRLRIARHTNRPGKRRLTHTYERLLGKNYDPRDVVKHMRRFVEFEFSQPGRGTPLSWRAHVEDWHRPEQRPGTIAYLSYEELLSDCAETLGRAIETVTGQPIDPWQLDTTIEKLSMKRQTGRDPGQSDMTQHIRKGVAGDWRNHFSREAAVLFNELAGDTLVRLGYEPDTNWVDRYDYPGT